MLTTSGKLLIGAMRGTDSKTKAGTEGATHNLTNPRRGHPAFNTSGFYSAFAPFGPTLWPGRRRWMAPFRLQRSTKCSWEADRSERRDFRHLSTKAAASISASELRGLDLAREWRFPKSGLHKFRGRPDCDECRGKLRRIRSSRVRGLSQNKDSGAESFSIERGEIILKFADLMYIR
jgi:hypothetical protein